NETERRWDEDLVDGGRIRTRQDRIAKSAVATARRIRRAGGAWEQQEHRSRRRLGIPFPNPPTKSDDLRSGERLRGVREHLAPGHGRIRFDQVVFPKIEMPDDGGIPWNVRETTLRQFSQATVHQVIPNEEHLAVERPIIVGLEVLSRRARR